MLRKHGRRNVDGWVWECVPCPQAAESGRRCGEACEECQGTQLKPLHRVDAFEGVGLLPALRDELDPTGATHVKLADAERNFRRACRDLRSALVAELARVDREILRLRGGDDDAGGGDREAPPRRPRPPATRERAAQAPAAPRLRARHRRARRGPAGAHVRHRADAALGQDDDAARDRRAQRPRALAFVTKRGEEFEGRRIRPYLPREGDQPIHWRLVETILASALGQRNMKYERLLDRQRREGRAVARGRAQATSSGSAPKPRARRPRRTS
jgi:hypothetical protein